MFVRSILDAEPACRLIGTAQKHHNLKTLMRLVRPFEHMNATNASVFAFVLAEPQPHEPPCVVSDDMRSAASSSSSSTYSSNSSSSDSSSSSERHRGRYN